MRRFKSISFLLSAITGLSVLLLVSVFTISAKDAFDAYRAASADYAAIDIARELFIAKEALRTEQGVVATALATQEPANLQTRVHIEELREKSRALYASAVERYTTEAGDAQGLAEIVKTNIAIETLSGEIRSALKLPANRRPKDLTSKWMAVIGEQAGILTKKYDDLFRRVDATDTLIALTRKVKSIMADVRDGAGGDRTRLASAITAGVQLTPAQLQSYAETTGRINAPWAAILQDMNLSTTPEALKIAVRKAQKTYFEDFIAQRERLILQLARGEKPAYNGQEWLLLSNPGLESIGAVSLAAFDLTKDHAGAKAQANGRKFYLAMGIMLVSILLAILTTFVVVWRIIRPLRQIAETMENVADGDLDHNIPFKHRHDEIGRFARALKTFRDNAREKQQMEAELLQNQVAKEAAEASNRVKTEFLANMSHELRTPLNAVIGFSDMMKQKMFGPLNAQYDEYAGLIHESGQLLLNLVSDILDVAKIEAGKFTLDIQDVSLHEAVESCMRLVKRRAEERHIAMRTSLPEAPLRFAADPRAFKQILLNLLSNAIKFTANGGWIDVIARVRDERLEIIVRDNGIGIPASALSRIGHAFEQASNDPTRAREGTGLGLALVRALAEQHDGKLAIDSIENIGTTVTIELPLTQPARKAA